MFSWHQVLQSGHQFLVVFLAELTTLAIRDGGSIPTPEDMYVPALLAGGASLAIWGGSKVRLRDDKNTPHSG